MRRKPETALCQKHCVSLLWLDIVGFTLGRARSTHNYLQQEMCFDIDTCDFCRAEVALEDFFSPVALFLDRRLNRGQSERSSVELRSRHPNPHSSDCSGQRTTVVGDCCFTQTTIVC